MNVCLRLSLLLVLLGGFLGAPPQEATPTGTRSGRTRRAEPPNPAPLKVTPYGQEHLLTCEAAALRMVLDYYGVQRTESEIQAAFPITEDPTRGLSGDRCGRQRRLCPLRRARARGGSCPTEASG